MKRKKNLLLLSLAALLTIAALTAGCGSGQKTIPYPETYYVPIPEAAEEGGEQEAASEEMTAVHGETGTSASENAPAAKAPSKEMIVFLYDTSGSMERYTEEITKIHSAATKGAAGYQDKKYYALDDSGELVETTEELALSSAYAAGAPLDLIEKGTLPIAKDGVNILTTDLASNTSAIQLGRWLADTGCTGFSFYVFKVAYNGNLEFRMYTSRNDLEAVTVKNCHLPQKEFLMIVFGDNRLVEEYDGIFKEKLDSRINFDMCHASLNEGTEDTTLFLKMNSSHCFTDDVANVTFDNTNWVYGLKQIEPEDVIFTLRNTFVYKKSRYSSHSAKEAVKVVLYAVPETPLPAIDHVKITSVQEYDSKSGSYKESMVSFPVEISAWIDGMPSVNEEPESEAPDSAEKSKTYEYLNRALGGPIVESGPVLSVSIRNEQLPPGLYAVEGSIVFKSSSKIRDLQSFGSSHSAGLEDYKKALEAECDAEKAEGKASKSHFLYTGTGTSSVFNRLLEFEKVTDELSAAGAVTEAPAKTAPFRLIIDNR